MTIRTQAGVAAGLVLVLAGVIGVGGQGAPAAPVLVVLNDSAPNPFGRYLPEILRAEGINSFSTVQLSALDGPTLNAAALTVLAETPLTAPQATLFTNYVAGGGRLVAMRPDPQLAGVLGITPVAGASTTNGYALINQSGPGAGLQNVTLALQGPGRPLRPGRRHRRGGPLHDADGGGGPARRGPLQPHRGVELRPGAKHGLHPAGRPGRCRPGPRRSGGLSHQRPLLPGHRLSSASRCRTPTCTCACSAA